MSHALMSKPLIKRILSFFHIDPIRLKESLGFLSLSFSKNENKFEQLFRKLEAIVPDISKQEESESLQFNPFWEKKRRLLQVFQCAMMLDAVKDLAQHKSEITVVDIGDSAGTHMIYLRELVKDICKINSISVNLDPRAIEKIKARGLKALHCRAENIEFENISIDLFTSFECVEHLHDPSVFFHRLSNRNDCSHFIVTVPFVRESRVGLHSIRNDTKLTVFAEDEHVFELAPDDWALLLLHSGWRIKRKKIYYQYPRKLFPLSLFFSVFWKAVDYEGFLGMELVKDTTYSKLYKDWES